MNSPPPVLPKLRSEMLPWTAEKEVQMRLAVCAEARTWLRTPYIQMADIKGAGIDCSMLLVRCWVDAGICEPFDPRPYPPNWHMHHSEERYLGWLNTLAVEVDEPKMGDVVVFQFGRCFSHSGILINSTSMVNAWASKDCVISDLKEGWLTYMGKSGTLRPRKFFDVFAKLRQSQEPI